MTTMTDANLSHKLVRSAVNHTDLIVQTVFYNVTRIVLQSAHSIT